MQVITDVYAIACLTFSCKRTDIYRIIKLSGYDLHLGIGVTHFKSVRDCCEMIAVVRRPWHTESHQSHRRTCYHAAVQCWWYRQCRTCQTMHQTCVSHCTKCSHISCHYIVQTRPPWSPPGVMQHLRAGPLQPSTHLWTLQCSPDPATTMSCRNPVTITQWQLQYSNRRYIAFPTPPDVTSVPPFGSPGCHICGPHNVHLTMPQWCRVETLWQSHSDTCSYLFKQTVYGIPPWMSHLCPPDVTSVPSGCHICGLHNVHLTMPQWCRVETLWHL